MSVVVKQPSVRVMAEPNVLDAYHEGVTFNGVNDDTAALRAVINKAAQVADPSTAARAVHLRGGDIIVNSMIECPASTVLRGEGADLTRIHAGSSFTFTDGNTAIFKSYGAVFGAPGPSRRLTLEGIMLDGSSRPNSNGILASPQQPGRWDNVRVNNCKGYGVYVGDTQQLVATNIQLMNNGVGWWGDGMEFCWIFGLNIEQSDTRHMLLSRQGGGGLDSSHNGFVGIHLEACDGTEFIRVEGRALNNYFASGYSDAGMVGGDVFKFDSVGVNPEEGGCTYTIQNFRTVNHPAITLVHDLDRGLTLNADSYFNDYIGHFAAPPMNPGPATPPSHVIAGKAGRLIRFAAGDGSASIETHGGTADGAASHQQAAYHSSGALRWQVSVAGIPVLPTFTAATRPAAGATGYQAGALIMVTDAAAGSKVQCSDGAAWIGVG